MSETQSRDSIQIGGKKVSMHGKFRLTCNMPADKFHLTNINANVPLGKDIADKDYFYDVRGKRNFLLIDKIVTYFKPDINDIDAKNVAALIRNEDVRIEDMSEQEHKDLVDRGLKKPNPQFSILNVDKSLIDKHEEDLELIEIKYMIARKKDALSKKKLMFITSAIGLSVASEITDEVRYIAFLQKQLMDYLTVNKEKRKEFEFFYEKIADAEILYYINQFIEMGYIKDLGGIYKVDDKPVGFSISDVKTYFATNEDDYEKLKFKVDEFNSKNVKR